MIESSHRAVMSTEYRKLLQKRIHIALDGGHFPPPGLPPLKAEIVSRAIHHIGLDPRLSALFARIDDDESLCRTFLSLYFHADAVTP